MSRDGHGGLTETSEVEGGGESVSFDKVTKSYGSHEVLHAFSLEIGAGEMVSLLGPSGCGKSTALRCLAGFESISSGDVTIGERSVVGVPPRRRGIGMVFQHYSLFPNMTVLENVAFGLKVKRVPRDERRARALKMLNMVGLDDFAESFPSRLSGGQQQRVALARAIVINPRVLLLDEPLSALDAKIRVQLRDEIRSLQRRLGITSIFVTHDQEEALAVSDRIAVMHDGVIEQIGEPRDLYVRPATPFVADFVGQSNKVETKIGSDGMVTVCGSSIPVSNAASPGTLVTVFIRPENVILESAVDGPYMVVHESFLGAFQRTLVDVGPFTMVSQHDPSVHFRVGDHVRLSIRPNPVVCDPIEIRWANDSKDSSEENGR